MKSGEAAKSITSLVKVHAAVVCELQYADGQRDRRTHGYTYGFSFLASRA
jgi:hypothetical protein